MNTPFQYTKAVASHFGGTRNPLIISWPARIKDKGGLRGQFHHVIDVAPTILEAVGVTAPDVLNGVAQSPLQGISMTYTFDDAKASDRHKVQVFELAGNRGIYENGWIDGGGMGKGGVLTLLVNGKKVGEGRVEKTTPYKYALAEGQSIGEDAGSPIDFSYTPPFKFTGKLGTVTVELK
jgi:arylsulfatase A-like enzyme